MGDFQNFSFGRDDDNIASDRKRFKAEAGRKYRVSFAWWDGYDKGDLDLDADGPEFIGSQRNYIQGVGYIINKGPEYTKIAGKAPRMAIATIIVLWPMDSKGNLDKQGIKNGDFDVMPWVFSKDKYEALSPIHREFHFGRHDVMINCTETKYQKMTFSPCKDSLLAKFKEKGGDIWDSVVEKVQAVADDIQSDLGRDLSLDQIREKVAGGEGAGVGFNPDSVLSSSIEDIDSMVDDLLD